MAGLDPRTHHHQRQQHYDPKCKLLSMLVSTMKHASTLGEKSLCREKEGEVHTKGSALYVLSISGGNAVIPWIWKWKSRQCQWVHDLRAGLQPSLLSPSTSAGIEGVRGREGSGWLLKVSNIRGSQNLRNSEGREEDQICLWERRDTKQSPLLFETLILILLHQNFSFRINFPLQRK